MAEPNYYYNKGGQPTGPISVVQLKQLADSGQIKPADLVWREGTPNWVAASTVKGLFGSVTPPNPGAPPPHPGSPPTSAGTAAPARPADRPSSSRSEESAAAAEFARQAAQQARATSQEAWAAIKVLISDPVGGIGRVYESLGPSRALVVGGTFLGACVVSVILVAIFAASAASDIGNAFSWSYPRANVSFATFLRGMTILIIVDAAYLATLIGMTWFFRMWSTRSSTLAGSVLVVGIGSLPSHVAALASSFLIFLIRPGLILTLLLGGIWAFAIAFVVLLLFSGQVKVIGLSERLAAIAVPAMLFAGGVVALMLMWLFS